MKVKLNKKQLEYLYWDKKLSINGIVKILGCSHTKIYHYLKKYNISCRTISESHKELYKNPKNHPFYDRHHTEEAKEKISQKLKGRKHTEEAKKKMSKRLKGRIFSKEWKRKISQNHANILGKNNPNWRGGISFESYTPEFNDELKESIRKRDDYRCQICDMTEEEHLIVYGVKLSVHHIDYDKKNNNPENLTTLGISCHMRTNFNRDYWINYFKMKEGLK